jgi:DNA-binding SARP family transcriptional activator
MARFGILGPLLVTHAGGTPKLGGPKQRTLLAALLVHARRPMSLAGIVDALWGDQPPASAVANVYTHVNRLRDAFADVGLAGLLVTDSSGYRLLIAPDQLDSETFEAAAERARAALAAGDTGAFWQEAWAVWRGVLIEELGVEPCGEIQELHQEILRGAPPESHARPMQLPPDAENFTGREAERVEFRRLLTKQSRPVAAITGKAGVGKTTLAARQVLIVLDDAANMAQVRPLLPGTAGSAVLITSRVRLLEAPTVHLDVLGRRGRRAVAGVDRRAVTHDCGARLGGGGRALLQQPPAGAAHRRVPAGSPYTLDGRQARGTAGGRENSAERAAHRRPRDAREPGVELRVAG